MAGGRKTDTRTVHAENETHELVRYDRMGKWFIEVKDSPRRGGQSASMVTAVNWALRKATVVHLRKAGGTQFDAAYRKNVAS